MSIDDLLNRLEAAERAFVGTRFLAPVLGANQVTTVRIAGVVCRLCVRSGLPAGFRGWAVFRALSLDEAVFEQPASLDQTARYLALLPSVRLVLLADLGQRWLALPAHRGDTRFAIEGTVPLWLAEPGLERFDTVLARFDGRLLFHERRDPARDPSIAAALRQALVQTGPDGLPPAPDALSRPGLTPEERGAYGLLRERLTEQLVDRTERRLAEALSHAGAMLVSYHEREQRYVVRFVAGGRSHTAVVEPDDLTLSAAGVCLAGEDRKFDLTSLVGVLHEGRRSGELEWDGLE